MALITGLVALLLNTNTLGRPYLSACGCRSGVRERVLDALPAGNGTRVPRVPIIHQRRRWVEGGREGGREVDREGWRGG